MCVHASFCVIVVNDACKIDVHVNAVVVWLLTLVLCHVLCCTLNVYTYYVCMLEYQCHACMQKILFVYCILFVALFTIFMDHFFA